MHEASDSSEPETLGSAAPVPDAALHIDSYPLDVLPDIDIEQQQQQAMQHELRTTVSPSELHSLSPHHQITLDGDARAMHSGEVIDEGLGMGADAHMGDNEDDWTPADEWSTAEMRRVKVYELKGSCWNDRGTGMCSADYDESTEKAVIIVKSEFTEGELLRCEIRAQDVYQRQQGEQGDLGQTLIVWTEPDGTDFALSFQDLDGCGEIWDFIQEVQRHLRGKQDPTSSSPPSTPRMSLDRRVAQSFMHAGQIPAPDFNTIGDIDRAIKLLSKNPTLKEKICETLVYQKFVCSLIELFYEAERSEYLVHLHALCRIMQTIIMLNEHSMYEHMLSDDIFPGVLGILEYDPEFPEHKGSYRDFLSSVAQYREAVPIRDPAVRRKIHQTYRLLFLKDVVLARMLDDPTFNILNSFIIFNQIDIVTHFQHEETLLHRMFSAFPQLRTKDGKSALETVEDPSNIPPQPNGSSSPEIGPIPLPPSAISPDQDTRRRDIIRMTHQLCATAKNVQVSTRFALYRLLVDRGVLYMIQWALSVQNPDPDMLSIQHLCGDILLSVMEYDPHGVRQNVLHHAEAGVRTLLEQLIATMGGTKDLALRSQIADAIRVLLEVQGAGSDMGLGDRPTAAAAAKAAMARREDPATEKFLLFFYEQCIISLYKPILALPSFQALQGAPLNTQRDQASQFLFLCDLLSNFVLQHGHRCQFYICASDIAVKLASLLSSREKHVRLAALRVFRACFRSSNVFVTRHLIKQDVVLPIIELTARESRRDNMLSSTCQEFFEYIRRENLRLVIDYMMDKHGERVRDLAKLPMVGMRFAGIVLRWEQNHEEPPPAEPVANSTNGNSTRRWGSGRLMDAEEEDYFNSADEETLEVPLKWAPVQIPPMNTLKRKRGRVALGSGARVRAGSDGSGSTPVFQPIKPPSAGLLGLADYEEDEEDLGVVTGSSSDGMLSFQNVLSPSPMPLDSNPPKESSPSPERKMNRSATFVAESPTAARLAEMGAEGGESEQMDTFPVTLLESGLSGPPALSQLRAEKRRREEEEDELLALYSSGKRATGNAKEAEEDTFPLVGKLAGTGDGAKKMKLSLGKGAAAVAGSPTPSATVDAAGGG
ncbi:Platinum sensitivity protein [Ceratobasidium sp. 394]|nr:Platinum sensitivity protein [Ceratobasidium sp. 394]KAG9101991.1 Platinum sensitivity protein [Ceratobasidium sp. UAMH 11750]